MNFRNSLFNTLILLIFLISLPLSIKYLQERYCNETRFAFDFGSGAIKSEAAIVNACTNKIVKIFGRFEKLSKFESCLEKNAEGQKVLSANCIQRTANEFSAFQKEYNMSCVKDKCGAIATAWARKISNVQDVVDILKQQGLTLNVVSQEEEGTISFKAVAKSQLAKGMDISKLVVWDIGGGSFQFSTLDEKGKIYVYNGPDGVESFDRKIREKYNVSTSAQFPFFNKHLSEEIYQYAIDTYGKPIMQDAVISKKLLDPDLNLIAIGGPMNKFITGHLALPEHVKREHLYQTALSFDGITTQKAMSLYPKIPVFYIHSPQSLLLMISGILAGIQKEYLDIATIGLTDYVILEDEIFEK